jgi:hypothetical protein
LHHLKTGEYTQKYLSLIHIAMEGSRHFGAPHITTDTATFDPASIIKGLPEHLKQYEKIARERRFEMTPIMKGIAELTSLTDCMATRCAAIPESN